MAPSSNMGEKQAEATSVSRRAGQLIDPRDQQEQVAMAPGKTLSGPAHSVTRISDMFTAFAVLTIEPLAHTGFEQV